MYQAPIGRPISSPPSDHLNGSSATPTRQRRVDDALRAAIMADHAAGMARNDIARKHGRHHSTVSWVIGYRPPKKDSKPARPVRRDGETSNQYGIRVQAWMIENDPDYTARWRRQMESGIAKARTKQIRQARAACVALNKHEARGVWHTAASISAAKGNISTFLTSKFATAHALEVRQFGKFRIYLIPHAALGLEAPQPVVPVPVNPPAPVITPPPSIWQRLFSWVRW